MDAASNRGIDDIKELIDEGLYPYTKRYLGSFNNHFSALILLSE
jgi:ribonucleoside-triphosphate reductase